MLRNRKKKDDKQEHERWQARLRLAISKQAEQVANWHRWASIIDDNLWGGQKLKDGTTPAQDNELKAAMFAILPYIILEPPVIEVRSYSFDDTLPAFIWERVAETLETRLNLFETFTRVGYDGLLYGDGIVKIGIWEDMLISHETWGSGITEPFGTRYSGHISHTPLEEMYLDYRVNKWTEQEWIIHQFPRHIDDVKDNSVYDPKVTKKLEPHISAEKLYQIEIEEEDMRGEYVAIQEIHHFKEGQVKVMAEGANDWLYQGPEPYGIIPFGHLQFMFRPRVIWGDSISQVVEQHQKSISEAITYMNRAMARDGLAKVMVRLAEWNEEAIRKLESNEDEIIGINAQDLRNAVEVIDYKTASKEYNFVTGISLLKQIIRSNTGVAMQDRGQHEPGVETLGEVNMLQQASDIRNRMRQRMFSRFASEALGKLLFIISQTYTPERIAKLAGLSPIPMYAQVISQMGPFDETRFQLDYGQTAMNSRNERIQKIMVFQQMMGPFMQFVNPVVFAKMATDALGFDWNTELMLYQSLNMMGTGGGGQGGQGQQQMQGPATQVAQSRMVQPQQQQGF